MFDLLIEIEKMATSGFEQATIDAAIQRNIMVERFQASPLGPHLRSIEGADIAEANDGRLLGTPAIKGLPWRVNCYRNGCVSEFSTI